MKYSAIIFDLDGVLCFTDRYHYQAWKALADRLGLYFDEKINDRLRGVSRMASLDIVLERSPIAYTDAEKEAMANEKNEHYRRLLSHMTPDDISPEIRQTLCALRKSGLKLAIGSSSKNTPIILEKTDLGQYFDAVSDGNNITHSKPDPEVFRKAAQFLNEEPCRCLVVEDAVAGIDAGVAGGFDTAGLGEAADYEKTTYPLPSFSSLLDCVQENDIVD